MKFRALHLLSALGLHGLLFLMLAVSVRCTPMAAPPAVIQGVLLDPSRDQTVRREKAMAENKRAAEQERAKQEKQKKDKEREDARLDEQRKQAELKKVEQDNLRNKQVLEEKKKVDQAKKKIEQEKKLKEEQRRKEQKERQSALEKSEQDLRRQQMEAEATEIENKQQQRQAQVAFNNWSALVAEQVRRNWLRPPDSNEQFECIVRIEQLPGGQIMSSRMVQSCGNKLLDDSVLKAVEKSNPLPLVTDPAAFQRSFTFKFVPK